MGAARMSPLYKGSFLTEDRLYLELRIASRRTCQLFYHWVGGGGSTGAASTGGAGSAGGGASLTGGASAGAGCGGAGAGAS